MPAERSGAATPFIPLPGSLPQRVDSGLPREEHDEQQHHDQCRLAPDCLHWVSLSPGEYALLINGSVFRAPHSGGNHPEWGRAQVGQGAAGSVKRASSPFSLLTLELD